MKSERLLGAVLAGGGSRRFGRDKAAESIAGTSLVERAARTLDDVFAHVVIVSSRTPVATVWPHLPDVRPGEGPLAGIEAALLHAEKEDLDGAFVLACDMPLVTADTVRTVVASLGDSAACAPARDAPGGEEVLCAAYRVSCLPAVSAALDGGRRAVREAFTAVGGVAVPVSADVFLNVNVPEDAERAASALEAMR